MATVQVAEGKETQFRYLKAIESVQAVGKDIYTFGNGRVVNLPKEGTGAGKLGGKAFLSPVLPPSFRLSHPRRRFVQPLSTPNARGSSAARSLWSRFPRHRVGIAPTVATAMAVAMAAAPVRNRNG